MSFESTAAPLLEKNEAETPTNELAEFLPPWVAEMFDDIDTLYPQSEVSPDSLPGNQLLKRLRNFLLSPDVVFDLDSNGQTVVATVALINTFNTSESSNNSIGSIQYQKGQITLVYRREKNIELNIEEAVFRLTFKPDGERTIEKKITPAVFAPTDEVLSLENVANRMKSAYTSTTPPKESQQDYSAVKTTIASAPFLLAKNQNSENIQKPTRRSFLRLLLIGAAVAATAQLAGQSRPPEKQISLRVTRPMYSLQFLAALNYETPRMTACCTMPPESEFAVTKAVSTRYLAAALQHLKQTDFSRYSNSERIDTEQQLLVMTSKNPQEVFQVVAGISPRNPNFDDTNVIVIRHLPSSASSNLLEGFANEPFPFLLLRPNYQIALQGEPSAWQNWLPDFQSGDLTIIPQEQPQEQTPLQPEIPYSVTRLFGIKA